MISETPTHVRQLSVLLKQGEGKTLEFKRSTGELKEGLQTLCAFLNTTGGMVLFGFRPDGKAEGQNVTDQTLREIAQALERFPARNAFPFLLEAGIIGPESLSFN